MAEADLVTGIKERMTFEGDDWSHQCIVTRIRNYAREEFYCISDIHKLLNKECSAIKQMEKYDGELTLAAKFKPENTGRHLRYIPVDMIAGLRRKFIAHVDDCDVCKAVLRDEASEESESDDESDDGDSGDDDSADDDTISTIQTRRRVVDIISLDSDDDPDDESFDDEPVDRKKKRSRVINESDEEDEELLRPRLKITKTRD